MINGKNNWRKCETSRKRVPDFVITYIAFVATRTESDDGFCGQEVDRDVTPR